MDTGVWWATVQGVAKSQTRLKRLSMHMYILQWASQVVLVVKKLPANRGDVRDVGSIPGSGRSPGEGNDSPLQHSCLENPMDTGVW